MKFSKLRKKLEKIISGEKQVDVEKITKLRSALVKKQSKYQGKLAAETDAEKVQVLKTKLGVLENKFIAIDKLLN